MVWWAGLCQKVQGHFLAPVRPCTAPVTDDSMKIQVFTVTFDFVIYITQQITMK